MYEYMLVRFGCVLCRKVIIALICFLYQHVYCTYLMYVGINLSKRLVDY